MLCYGLIRLIKPLDADIFSGKPGNSNEYSSTINKKESLFLF